jgi:hypothetical protein
LVFAPRSLDWAVTPEIAKAAAIRIRIVAVTREFDLDLN